MVEKRKCGAVEEGAEKRQKGEKKSDEYYNDANADVTLISSDNVVFKVYAYHLQAMRYVWVIGLTGTLY